MGNRLTKLTGGITTTYSYDVANRIETERTPPTTTTYSFDSNGNTTLKNAAGQRTTMTWDGENRMTVIALPTPATQTMTYDGDSFRRSVQEATSTTKFLNDRRTGTPGIDPIVLELNASDATVAQYTTLP